MGTKKPLCEFGQNIEICLVKINRTNAWLIEQVAKDTGKYFDRSYLQQNQNRGNCNAQYRCQYPQDSEFV